MCPMINAASISSDSIHGLCYVLYILKEEISAQYNKSQWMGRLKWFARLSFNLSGIENLSKEY